VQLRYRRFGGPLGKIPHSSNQGHGPQEQNMQLLKSAPSWSRHELCIRAAATFAPATSHQPPATLRSGLTLIEMLISLACVILLMLAYTQLFAEAGSRINDARAQIDVTNRLRSAQKQLTYDLTGATAHTSPGLRPEGGGGYFEIIEGRLRDTRIQEDDSGPTEVFETGLTPYPIGDVDDAIFLTVRKKNGNFTGKFGSQTIQSEVAEVVWFLRPTVQPDPANLGAANPALVAGPLTYTLYRRTFLVTPSYTGDFPGVPAPTAAPHIPPVANPPVLPPRVSFYDLYDVSARYDPVSGRYVANTLADLTKRECRYGHQVDNTTANRGFPHVVDNRWMWPFGVTFNTTSGVPFDSTTSQYYIDTSHPRYGEDVVLTNVLAFDVQVWDPTAPVYVTSTTPPVAVAPGDPGFNPSIVTVTSPPPPKRYFPLASSLGAYVDLNWGASYGVVDGVYYPTTSDPPVSLSPFYSRGYSNSGLVATFYAGPTPPSIPAVYDVWSFHYEHDGINQDVVADGATPLIDEGTDGFDNDNANGVDDPGERETSAPYPAPLRGIKVRIRVYEPDTRQIREVSVVHSFVPE
jgi:type II secretory pathway pseudopilin PulG